MASKRTTRQQDAEFILRRHAEATRPWKIGDRCLSVSFVTDAHGYSARRVTTVKYVDGDIITLANGDILHRSRMEAAPVEVK